LPICRTWDLTCSQDLCLAGLQAAMEDYRWLYGEHPRLVEFIYQQQILIVQKQVELERRQRLHAENQLLVAVHEIQDRRERKKAAASISIR
jgi:hypothetical protein